MKNNFFEFNSKTEEQISGTAIGTKFAPIYACNFMDKEETKFLDKGLLKPCVWLRYSNGIFFLSTHGKENLQAFLEQLGNFHPCLIFPSEISVLQLNFLDFIVKSQENEFWQIVRKLIVISIIIMIPVIQNTRKNLVCIAKDFVLKDSALTVKTARLTYKINCTKNGVFH